MTRIKAKRGTVQSAGGWEQYLRDEYDLRDDVELETIKDGGMHGNRVFVFDTPDGEVTCSGYISQPPVATYKMTVSGADVRQALFGMDEYEELKAHQDAATTGFEDV